jgi:hypothetical protein
MAHIDVRSPCRSTFEVPVARGLCLAVSAFRLCFYDNSRLCCSAILPNLHRRHILPRLDPASSSRASRFAPGIRSEIYYMTQRAAAARPVCPSVGSFIRPRARASSVDSCCFFALPRHLHRRPRPIGKWLTAPQMVSEAHGRRGFECGSRLKSADLCPRQL